MFLYGPTLLSYLFGRLKVAALPETGSAGRRPSFRSEPPVEEQFARYLPVFLLVVVEHMGVRFFTWDPPLRLVSVRKGPVLPLITIWSTAGPRAPLQQNAYSAL